MRNDSHAHRRVQTRRRSTAASLRFAVASWILASLVGCPGSGEFGDDTSVVGDDSALLDDDATADDDTTPNPYDDTTPLPDDDMSSATVMGPPPRHDQGTTLPAGIPQNMRGRAGPSLH